jgi:hypothetical protein
MSDLMIEPQEKSEWCWAAVAVSVEKYFNPASTLKQCDIATRFFQRDCCNKGLLDHDEPVEVKDVLETINRLRTSLDGPLTFDALRKEIDTGRPVCACIVWRSGGGHAVLVTGYSILASGARHVHVEDPLNPSVDIDFEEFVSAYHGDGEWVETELLLSV